MKLEFVPSAANFVLVKVGDGAAIFKALLQRRIIVRALKGYHLAGVGPHFHRHDGTEPRLHRRTAGSAGRLTPPMWVWYRVWYALGDQSDLLARSRKRLERLQRLARRWQVSKTEVIRRAARESGRECCAIARTSESPPCTNSSA